MRFKDTDLVQLQCEDTSDVPEIKFDFKPLDQLDGVEPKQTCDIITVVEEVGELTSIITKAQQKPFAKRELTLVDQTAMSVRLTLWGKTAETYGTSSGQVGCGEDDKPVIAFKGVSVSDFGGRSLSMFSSATMTVNPDIPEAHSLRGWYDTEGMALAQNKSFKTYASAGMGGVGAGAGGDFVANIKERRTIAEAKDENLGMAGGDKPDYFNLRAMVVHIRHENLYYPACPSDGCNKKVNLEEGNNTWRCEKCDRSFDAPEYRYIISANVQDHTGQMWLSGFNDVGVQMLGITANEYNAAKVSTTPR
jgi:replication factor A1